MDIPRSLQDFLGSGAGDSAPCTIIDGPVRTRSGGTVLQREDDDGGPADEAVNQEDGAPLLRVGAVVDAAAVAFGETYVEQARNGSGPQKFRGTIVAATVNDDYWNVKYADGKVYATEAQHLTLVVEEAPQPYPVGTSVEALWNGGARFYPALVVAAREGAVDLRYTDSDEEFDVPLDRVQPLARRRRSVYAGEAPVALPPPVTPVAATPRRATAPAMDAFEINSANDGSGLAVGDRVFAAFDGEAQVWWGGTIVESTLYCDGEDLHIVFDDASDHHMWASTVARALPPSITLNVDRPSRAALEKIERLKASGEGRKRKAPDKIDPEFLAASPYGERAPRKPKPPPKRQVMASVELYAGSGETSAWLRDIGFATTTVDVDPRCQVDVVDDVLNLPRTFCDRANVVVAGVECGTYTYLQGGAHRSLEQPEGFSPQALQANREAEHLLAMFRSAKRANSKTIFLVENPAAYMQHTEFARRMEMELGLTRLRVTFCSFTVGPERVRKPTHLWTNSRVLIGMFKDDIFYCTPDKPCGCAKHISVRPAPGAGYRSRDAAWWPVEFAAFVARILANEARSLAA